MIVTCITHDCDFLEDLEESSVDMDPKSVPDEYAEKEQDIDKVTEKEQDVDQVAEKEQDVDKVAEKEQDVDQVAEKE